MKPVRLRLRKILGRVLFYIFVPFCLIGWGIGVLRVLLKFYLTVFKLRKKRGNHFSILTENG